jgi:hypothetical protein
LRGCDSVNQDDEALRGQHSCLVHPLFLQNPML